MPSAVARTYLVSCRLGNRASGKWLLRKVLKGTDRLCKIVKLSMQCFGQILQDSFETYKTFPQCIITEFEYIVDVQNHEFGWVSFQNRVF